MGWIWAGLALFGGAALALDHLGLLGFPVHTAALGRVVGVVCLIADAVLIHTT